MLTPQPLSRVQRFKEYAADKRQIFKKYANYKCNSFVNWLLENVPPKPKVINKVFEFAKNTILKLFPRKKDTFDVEETKSALGEFVKEYVITSRDVYDPDSFMDAAKETVNILENNRQTKVKLILKCIMERTEIKTGEVIVKDAAFHSEQEVYLEGTDTEEIYMKMKDRIIENLTVFQKGQSGWRFRSIVSLNVFTAEYKPLKGSSYIPLPSCLASKNAKRR